MKLSRFTSIAAVSFALANALDTCFTAGILAVGGTELNPISAWFIESLGYSGLLAFKLIIGTLFVVVFSEELVPRVNGKKIVTFLNVGLWLIVAWNAAWYVYELNFL